MQMEGRVGQNKLTFVGNTLLKLNLGCIEICTAGLTLAFAKDGAELNAINKTVNSYGSKPATKP